MIPELGTFVPDIVSPTSILVVESTFIVFTPTAAVVATPTVSSPDVNSKLSDIGINDLDE